jgi:hypothetical protein
MTQYNDIVEKRRIFLEAEEWGNRVAQHYVCKGGVGDLGFGMGYFIYYNNGAVHKLSNNRITIVQQQMPIEEVMDAYVRKDS